MNYFYTKWIQNKTNSIRNRQKLSKYQINKLKPNEIELKEIENKINLKWN